MLSYKKMDANALCDIIVEEIGVPLPTYDYKYKKFVIGLPQNIKIGDCVTGIEKADMFDSFKEACMSIINWHLAQKPKFTKVITTRGKKWKQDVEVRDCIMCRYSVACSTFECCSPSCEITNECFGHNSVGTWCPFGDIPEDKKFLFK